MKSFKNLLKLGSNKKALIKEGTGLITCLLLFNIIEKKFIGVALTKGRSMEPNLLDTHVVIIDRFFYKYIPRFSL